jgi:hypothetical protein
MGGRRMNRGDEGGQIWLIFFVYLYDWFRVERG